MKRGHASGYAPLASLRVTLGGGPPALPTASAGAYHAFTCSTSPHHQYPALEHPDGCATARPLRMRPRVSPAPKAQPEHRRGFRAPVGTIAFLTALYGVLYLSWEQSHWGSEAVRDLVGNVAFMPLNLGVLALFALASRKRVLDPARPPGAPPVGIGSGMVFIGNAISAWYVHRPARQPAGLLGRSVLPLRLAAHAHRAAARSRWRGAPGSSGGSSCSTPRWCWSAAAWRSGTSRSGRPPRRRRAASSSRCWRSPIRWRACWCCSASRPCCSAGRSTATGWRSACW